MSKCNFFVKTIYCHNEKFDEQFELWKKEEVEKKLGLLDYVDKIDIKHPTDDRAFGYHYITYHVKTKI